MDSEFPTAVKAFLGNDAPESITAIGNRSLLHLNALALLCSAKCPGSHILRTYDLVQQLRHMGVAVVSGFHSPMERECLTILLRGEAPIIICPARNIDGMRLPAEFKKPLDSGRLLILSPFAETLRRPTVQSSLYRNRFVAALAHSIFVAYAAPASKTEGFCRDVLRWGKPVLTFDSEANANLLALEARPVRADKLQDWLGTLGMGRLEKP